MLVPRFHNRLRGCKFLLPYKVRLPEQFEIKQKQVKSKRKWDEAINPGRKGLPDWKKRLTFFQAD